MVRLAGWRHCPHTSDDGITNHKPHSRYFSAYARVQERCPMCSEKAHLSFRWGSLVPCSVPVLLSSRSVSAATPASLLVFGRPALRQRENRLGAVASAMVALAAILAACSRDLRISFHREGSVPCPHSRPANRPWRGRRKPSHGVSHPEMSECEVVHRTGPVEKMEVGTTGRGRSA